MTGALATSAAAALPLAPLAATTDVMAAPLAFVEPFVFGAALVFARVTGILLGLPVLGNPAVPPAFRALLLFWLSVLVYVAIGTPPVALSVELLEALPLFLGEFLVGAAMGFAARVLLAVAEAAGSLMGLSAGLGLATAMDPVSGESGNTLGSLLLMLALVLFVTLGGHAALVGALLDSYHRYPLGDPSALPGLLENVVATGANLFELATRLAAPLAIVGLIVNVAMGLLVRVAPTLNLFAIGFLVVIAASLLLLYHEVPAIAVELKGTMDGLREALVVGKWGGDG